MIVFHGLFCHGEPARRVSPLNQISVNQHRTASRALLFALASLFLVVSMGLGVGQMGGSLGTTPARNLAAFCFLDSILLAGAALVRAPESGGVADSITGLRTAEAESPGSRWILSGILLLSVAVRLPGLDSQIWLDEIVTLVNYLRLPWYEVLSSYDSANQHLLYSVLGSISIRLFGEHFWSMRLPALLFGVASIWALDWMGRKVTSRRESLLAAALMALSYHHIWFSQSARGYSAMVFFTCLGTGLFLEGVRANRTRTWMAYAFTMALGVMALQNTAFVAVGHLAAWITVLLVRRPEASVARTITFRILGTMALAAYLSVHAHALILHQVVEFFRSTDRTGMGWTTVAGFVPVVTTGLQAGLGTLGLLLLFTLGVIAFGSYASQSLLFALAAVSPALFNIAALILLRTGAYPRSFLYTLPFALLFAIRGAETIEAFIRKSLGQKPGRYRIPAFAFLLIVLSMLPLPRLYRYPRQDYLGALNWIRERSRPGDSVAAVGLAATAYRSYYAPELDFPASPAELHAIEAGSQRVWVIYTFSRDMRIRFSNLLDDLESRYEDSMSFRGTVGDGTVHVMKWTAEPSHE